MTTRIRWTNTVTAKVCGEPSSIAIIGKYMVIITSPTCSMDHKDGVTLKTITGPVDIQFPDASGKLGIKIQPVGIAKHTAEADMFEVYPLQDNFNLALLNDVIKALRQVSS